MPLQRNAANTNLQSRDAVTWQQQLDAIAEMPLEPQEFCRRWVNKPAPGERGYRAACIRELARACGISERTVDGWGPNFERRPEHILVLLRTVDLLRQMLPHFEQHLGQQFSKIRE